jgi:hypothetical protein
MAWKRLNTPDILEVKYYPAKQRLKAHLRSGYSEVYAPIAESRYRELLAGAHPHDIDMFFMNMIRPSRISARATIRYRARRIARLLFIFVIIAGLLILFGLWNSGFIDSYLAKLFPTQT